MKENKMLYFAQDKKTGAIRTEPFLISGLGKGSWIIFKSEPDNPYPLERFMLASLVVFIGPDGEDEVVQGFSARELADEVLDTTGRRRPATEKEETELDKKAQEWDGFKKPGPFPVKSKEKKPKEEK